MRGAEDSIPKTALFQELGYAGPWEPLEEVLEEAGLSSRRKQRISRVKIEQVREVLRDRFALVCGRGDCQARTAEVLAGRRPAPALRQADCEVCGGSVNRNAVDQMVAACQRAELRRICVVGGSPEAHRQLEELISRRVELRLVGNERRHTHREAEANLLWADRVLIWGSTQIAHKVTELYRAGNPKVVMVHKRSVAELARAVMLSCKPSVVPSGQLPARRLEAGQRRASGPA